MKDVGIQEVIEMLRAGWALSNSGNGWYLASPPIPMHPLVPAVIRGVSDGEIMTLQWGEKIKITRCQGRGALYAELVGVDDGA